MLRIARSKSTSPRRGEVNRTRRSDPIKSHLAIVAIQRAPWRSHKQSAQIIGHNRSALTRNLNERSVVVHTTPLGRVDCLSANRNDGKHEQRGSREGTASFHGRILLTNNWL